jgi:hypothetical protein
VVVKPGAGLLQSSRCAKFKPCGSVASGYPLLYCELLLIPIANHVLFIRNVCCGSFGCSVASLRSTQPLQR